jgi:hypothetical protein
MKDGSETHRWTGHFAASTTAMIGIVVDAKLHTCFTDSPVVLASAASSVVDMLVALNRNQRGKVDDDDKK